MINRFAESVANYFVENEIVPAEDKSIYKYGIEVTISSALGIFIIIFSSAIIGRVQDGLLFLLCFVPIRVYVGGFHMNTYFTCNITFISVFLVNLRISRIITPYYSLCLILIALVIIALLAPIKNKYKNLSIGEKKQYKRIGIATSVFWSVMSIILFIFDINILSLMSVTMFTIAIFMVFEKIMQIKFRRIS